ncbi:MAG TPA: hypothetical protein VF250_03720 [Conexibacter sp.]
MRRKAAAALVVALALGACGGSDVTTVGRAEAVRRLEAACRAGTLEAQKVARSGRGDKTALEAIRTNFQTVMDKIDKLETSGPAKADLDAYKAALRTRLDALERVASEGSFRKALASEQPAMQAAGERALAAMKRLGAYHVCI